MVAAALQAVPHELPQAARRLLHSAAALHAHSEALQLTATLSGGLLGVVCLAAVVASMLGCFWPRKARPIPAESVADSEASESEADTESEDECSECNELPQRHSVDQLFAALRHKFGGKALKSLRGAPESAMERGVSGPSTGSTTASSRIPHGQQHSPAIGADGLGTPRGFIPSARLARQMAMQSPGSCESLDDEHGTAASIASLRSIDGQWGMNSWELCPDEVQICLDSRNRPWQLGCGGFGRVFRAEMAGSTPVAVKFVSRQSPRELRRFVHEIGILKSLRHTNIVQFLGAFLEGGQMVLVTEYMAGGDLFDVMGHDLQRDFSWYKRGQQVALDVVRGVVHMHSRKVIHLDLKSANILLTREGTAKIADVGLAKVLSREITQVSMESTFDWAAPEVLAGQSCSEKADIWSLGVVLWEIVSGEAPKLRQLRPLRVPEECPEAVRDVIVACRASTPGARPSAREVFDRLSAAVLDGLALPSKHLSGRARSRPAWAPPEHPRGEEVPTSTAALRESFGEGPPAAKRGGAAALPPLPHNRPSPGAVLAPPAWVRSVREQQQAYNRATSL